MKATFLEYDGCFSIDLQAENMAEAAKLVRFGMNRTGEINTCRTHVHANGDFSAVIVFAKSKRSDSTVPRRK